MALQSTTRIPTTQGSRYLVRLGKHWAHNLKGALTRHLDQLAFREAPLHFDWRDQ